MRVCTCVTESRGGTVEINATLYINYSSVKHFFFEKFHSEASYDQSPEPCFRGRLLLCVCVLIVQAVVRLWKSSIVDRFTFILYLLIFLLNAFSGILPVHVSPAILVLAAGATGILVSYIKAKQTHAQKME